MDMFDSKAIIQGDSKVGAFLSPANRASKNRFEAFLKYEQ